MPCCYSVDSWWPPPPSVGATLFSQSTDLRQHSFPRFLLTVDALFAAQRRRERTCILTHAHATLIPPSLPALLPSVCLLCATCVVFGRLSCNQDQPTTTPGALLWTSARDGRGQRQSAGMSASRWHAAASLVKVIHCFRFSLTLIPCASPQQRPPAGTRTDLRIPERGA